MWTRTNMQRAAVALLVLLAAAPAWAFVPSDVPGLLLWLEADNIDGQRNITLAPNSAVCGWADQSANHFVVSADPLVARVPVSCPTYRVNILNTIPNAPALEFNGTSDAFTLGHQLDCSLLNIATVGGISGGTPCGQSTVRFTSFVVVKALTKTNVVLWSDVDQYAQNSPDPCANVPYTGEGSGGGCFGYACNFHQCSQGRDLAFALYPYLSGQANLSVGTFDDLTFGPKSSSASALTFAADQPGDANFLNHTRVASYVFNQSAATIQSFWVDGTAQTGTAVHAFGSNARTRSAPNGTLEIGRWFYAPGTSNPDFVFKPFPLPAVPANWFQGYYAALLFYTGALSTANRQAVETYLTNKYELGNGMTPLPGTATPAVTGTPAPCPTCTPPPGSSPGTMGSCPGGTICCPP